MIEIRFALIRFIIDILFIILLFFAFMCGVHYGTQFIGLYFWFVKFLLGMVGVGLTLKVIDKVKFTLLFMLKNGSIYAQCCSECKSVLGSFAGIFRHFKSTIAVVTFNKLIRGCLSSISDQVLAASQESPLVGFLETLNDSKIAKASVAIVKKAFDYVDECILGYCYRNVSDEKSIFDCAVEGFVIFVKHSPKIFEKVLTIISLQFVVKIAYWVIYIMFCWKSVYFGISDIPSTLMNIVLCYCIGKMLNFILEDAILEPALMHGIISTFSQYSWSDDMVELEAKIESSVPAFSKLCNKSARKTNMDQTIEQDTVNNDSKEKSSDNDLGDTTEKLNREDHL